jgi:hypothetical protein
MMFSTFDTWGTKTALSLQELLPAGRQAVTALLLGLPKRQASRQTDRKQGFCLQDWPLGSRCRPPRC